MYNPDILPRIGMNKVQYQNGTTTSINHFYEKLLKFMEELKKEEEEKTMLDDIRCRNGNLTIVCGRIAENREEL